eukprot:CAMPEP_0185202578 /NCGR_PEP_ID=MMETSP1140-20130426/51369_1 /TAXON_ID=298111 /ORGANISM="Pavlova sp., Strain CCMP459" /LENGTH=107 /DNA_ID=CAMNT_0027770023 /DNA_START=49 /DNA_END=372 /DNA_ORIENTATION=-
METTTEQAGIVADIVRWGIPIPDPGPEAMVEQWKFAAEASREKAGAHADPWRIGASCRLRHGPSSMDAARPCPVEDAVHTEQYPPCPSRRLQRCPAHEGDAEPESEP